MKMNIKLNYSLQLLIILILAFIIRLYFAQTVWIDPDEGNWVYDSKLIIEGKTPFVDFASRSIVYMYMLIPFIKIFGTTLLAGRLLSVVAEIVSIFFLFKIGEKLYNKKIGIIASLIYALSPYITFYGVLLQSEPLQRTFVIIAMYFLVLAIQKNKNSYYLLNGLFLSIATLVRLSAALFFVTELLLLYIILKDYRKTLTKGFVIATGTLPLFLPFLIFLISAEHIYGLIPQKGFILNRIGSTFIINHLGMANALIKESLYMTFPIFIFLAYYFKNLLKTNIKLVKGFVILFSVSYIIGDIIAYFVLGNPFNINPILFVGFLSVILPLSLNTLKAIDLKVNIKKLQRNNFSNKFLLFWFFTPLIFYLPYYVWHLEYFTELVGVGSLIVGVLIYSIHKSRNTKIFKNLLIFMIIAALFTQILNVSPAFYQSRGIDRMWSPDTISEVSLYINENTSPDKEIFSNTIFAFVADRRIIFDISHAMVYHYETMDTENLNLMGYPGIEEIISYLDANEVKYVVVGPGFYETYLSIHPELEYYINQNYHVEKQIDNIEIFRINA